MSESLKVSNPNPDVGQSIEVRLENIRNRSGTVVDPGAVVGKFENPGGTETTYTYGTDAELVKESTGTYYFVLTVDAAGTWYVRMETTNPDVAREASFTVDASVF